MSTIVQQIAALRQLTMEATDLVEPYGMFMEHLANNREFISRSTATKHTVLMEIIIKAIDHSYHQKVNPRNCMMLKSRDDNNLIHGACTLQGRLLGFYYFEDAKIGMTALVEMNPPGMTHYSRFRTVMLNNKLTFHPGDPKVVH